MSGHGGGYSQRCRFVSTKWSVDRTKSPSVKTSLLHHLLGLSLLSLLLFGLTWGMSQALEVQRRVPLPFSDWPVESDEKKILLVFAGFPGCADTCPSALSSISAAYRALQDERLSIAFLNILHTASHQPARDYAKRFHPAFHGYSLQAHQREALLDTLGVKGGHTLQDVARHTGNVFLFTKTERQWVLKRIIRELPAHRVFVSQLREMLGKVEA